MGLLDALRANNIFGNPAGTPVGMPNLTLLPRANPIDLLYKQHQIEDADRTDAYDMQQFDQSNQANLARIAAAAAKPAPPPIGKDYSPFFPSSGWNLGGDSAGGNGKAANVRYVPDASDHSAALDTQPLTAWQQAQIDQKNAELGQKTAAEADKTQGNNLDRAIKQQRANVYEYNSKNPDHKIITPGDGHVYGINPKTNEKTDLGIDTLSDKDKLDLQQTGKLAAIDEEGKVTGQNQKDLETQRNTDVLGQIAARGKIAADSKAQADKNKADQLTTQTKTMMEGAQMILPHINELDQQAQDLNKAELFGPVMSRIRDIAAKVGTTGLGDSATPEEVQKSLDDFATAIGQDPQLQDARVGQFVTSLGLLASGAGRVHGGARGGGSIQMINYLKNLLSSDSTYDMFKGRLSSLNSYMKGYAAGPQSDTNNKLDSALDKIFGGQK